MTPHRFDLILRGATVLDGTGADAYPADIGMSGDTITAIGELEGAQAPTEIRIPEGDLVTPGFIDVHSHSDTYIFIEPGAPSKITQGITTEICGNCGASGAPIDDPSQLPSDWASFDYPSEWNTLAEYRDMVNHVRPAVNIAILVGHNTLRRGTVGYDNRAATPDELRTMVRRLEESLSAGARGFSTGLVYVPGIYAPREELVALARVAGRYGGMYASHMRSEGDALLEAIDETISLGREAGATIEISHLKATGRSNWHKLDAALERIERARDEGLPVAADRYPYVFGATELDVVFPAWFEEGGHAAVMARLADPALRARVRDELIAERPHQAWQAVLVGSTTDSDNVGFRGKSMVEVAEALDLEHPVDAVLHLCDTDRLTTGAFFGGMNEDNMRRVLKQPYVMLGSDASLRATSGPLGQDYPHPRAFGSFPRFLRMVQDEGLVSLPEAIRKMTSLPAQHFKLADRGVLAEGRRADLVVWDPSAVRDRASYADPRQLAEGIRHVIVNGVLTLQDGQATGCRAGRFV